jgi:hypothetical protein
MIHHHTFDGYIACNTLTERTPNGGTSENNCDRTQHRRVGQATCHMIRCIPFTHKTWCAPCLFTLYPSVHLVAQGAINQLPAWATMSGDIRLTPFYKVCHTYNMITSTRCIIHMAVPTRYGMGGRAYLIMHVCMNLRTNIFRVSLIAQHLNVVMTCRQQPCRIHAVSMP